MSVVEHSGMAIERASAEMNRASLSQLTKVMATSDRTFSAALAKRTTFLSRLFPTRIERVAKDGQVRVMEVELDFFVQTVAAIREMELANFRELATAGRARTVGELRKGTVAYLAQQWTELRDDLAQRVATLMEKLDKEAKDAERIENPVLKEVAQGRIASQILTFAEYVDRELQRFLELTEREYRS